MAASGGYVIVGLGNPGREYARNRHNVGFMVADELVARGGMNLRSQARMRAEVAEGRLGPLPGTRVVVAKPTTFMNDSGAAAAGLLRFYSVDVDALVVVHDEVDLPLGTLRVKTGGGDNGHNGLKSIRRSVGSGEFTRVRIGVGRPHGAATGGRPHGRRGDTAGWVLGDFSGGERDTVTEMIDMAADAVESYLEVGLEPTQSRYNS